MRGRYRNLASEWSLTQNQMYGIGRSGLKKATAPFPLLLLSIILGLFNWCPPPSISN